MNEAICLTQKRIAELFDVYPAITKHLKNIFESTELDKKVLGSILEHTMSVGFSGMSCHPIEMEVF